MSNWDTLIEIVRKRRSIRRFKPDPVPDADIEKILETGRWAMSGANAQPWEFIIVKDKETRAKIFEFYSFHRKHTDNFNRQLVPELRHPVTGTLEAGERSFRDAPVIIVVCGDTRTLLATSLSAEIIGYERVTYHMNMGNATMLMHLAAASLGLGSQWVSTTPVWEGNLKTLLGVDPWFTIPQIVPVGYVDFKPPPPYRRKLGEIVHHDKYDQSKARTEMEIFEYIADLRNRSRAAYYPGAETKEK